MLLYLRKFAKPKKLLYLCRLCPFKLSMSSSAQSVWKNANAICFDVDSTVIKDEGLDELANYCGVGNEVKEWTNKAMGGGVTFRTALKERLDIIKPTRQKVEEFLLKKPLELTKGIDDLVSSLHKRNVDVYLVSGGFVSIIEPVAEKLNIPKSHIYANRFKFYFNGEYAGFDESQPTSESGGKARVINILREKHGYKNMVMIGDGATDMEACPPADAFIGFGGNVVREKVKQGAQWFITDFNELICEEKS